MRIGPHIFEQKTVVAPMAGVTDRPFRELCRRMGAALAVSEMLTSDVRLYGTQKSMRRMDHSGESSPVSVQIAGGTPDMMADAARHNAGNGAQIIDINMGCPAKKVCNVQAGSALLKDELLVSRILDAVVKAVSIPVTLKIRTGWDPQNRNAIRIARIAENAGVQALTIHGRTRACGFGGHAEYETIAQVKTVVRIPVIANGDITTAQGARDVLRSTQADAIMIGRAAQGRPWIFRQINHYLATGTMLPEPTCEQIRSILTEHICGLHDFYGEQVGVRVARKHIGWYIKTLPGSEAFRRSINEKETVEAQLAEVQRLFDWLALSHGTWEEAA